ncbi:hypothetical protein Tco_1444559 [Tanacetum coccineum]
MAGVPNSCDGSSGPSSAGRGTGHGPISHDSDDDDEVHVCFKCGASDHVVDSCTNEGLSTYYYYDDDEVHSCFKCGANDHVADDPCPNEGRVDMKGGAYVPCVNCPEKGHGSLYCPYLDFSPPPV